MPEFVRTTREQRPSTSYASSLIRWLQLKKYQYEVTFSLYMLTPTERFIFNFILFVLVSMLAIAASLYLPNHIAVIYNRIWYYVHGEFANITANGASQAMNMGKSTVVPAQSAAVTTATFVAEAVETVIRRKGEL